MLRFNLSDATVVAVGSGQEWLVLIAISFTSN